METRFKNYVENILPRIKSVYGGYSGFAFLVDITTRIGVELTTLNWTSLIKEVVFEKGIKGLGSYLNLDQPTIDFSELLKRQITSNGYSLFDTITRREGNSRYVILILNSNGIIDVVSYVSANSTSGDRLLSEGAKAVFDRMQSKSSEIRWEVAEEIKFIKAY